jgi:hypothetical protein
VRDPHAATRRLISRYYNADALSAFAESDRFFAAVDVIAADEQPQRSAIMGVVGPPHRGAYFTFPDDDRDSRWWMGLRLHYGAHDEDGIPDPLATLRTSLDGLYGDVSRLARSGLAAILADG